MTPKKSKKTEPASKPAAPDTEEPEVSKKRKAEAIEEPQEDASDTQEEPKAKPIQNPPKERRRHRIVKEALKVGDTIPAGKVLREDGVEVDFKDLAKDQGIVVFLYPRANTSGCTKQACGFRDNYEKIKEAGYEVYGLSFGKSKTQPPWKKKHSLPFHLLVDKTGALLKAIGTFISPRSVVRSHMIVEKGGTIEAIAVRISPLDSVRLAMKSFTELTNRKKKQQRREELAAQNANKIAD